MAKVVVTGGAGFIGSNLTDKLIELGHEVVVIDNLSAGDYTNVNRKAYFYRTDLHKIDISDLYLECKDAEYIFHMAALPNVQYSIEEPLHTAKVNLLSTLNILEYARTYGVKKFIYSGSCSCYGNAEELPTTEDESIKPLSPYALHKYQGEEYCRLYSQIYNLDTVVLRYFNVYGPRMTNTGAYRSVLSVFLEAYKNKKPFNIANDGEQKRDFVHVSDVVNANIMAMESGEVSQYPINIGSGKNYSINEIADMFGSEKVYGEKRIEPQETLADIMTAKVMLNWKPKVELKNWIKEQI
jgi:UDP-glucose 4-epimerase